MTSTRDAALKLRAEGFRVIPLRQDKTPYLGKGLQHLQCTPEETLQWWQDWPDANIGIRLELSGLLVIDLDSPDAWADAKKRGLPETLTARSGFKPQNPEWRGYHYYYRVGDLPVTRKHCGPKGTIDYDIELLSKGYVVAPPSMHSSGVRYEWINDLPMADAPEWVRAIMDPPKPKPRPKPTFRVHSSQDDDLIEAQDALRVLDADCDHDTWVAIGMALHDIDTSRGLDVWDAWSSQGSKYKQGECERRWRSFSPGGGKTKATLFRLAMDHGWTAAKSPPPKVEYTRPELVEKPKVIEIDAGSAIYRYGRRVTRTKVVFDDGVATEDETIEIARDLEPIARTKDAEDGSHGCIVRYRTSEGHVRDLVAPCRAWSGDRSAANKFIAAAGDEGVQLRAMRGVQLAQALGEWHTLVEQAPMRTTVVRPGWHQDNDVYVNGTQVHGADWLYQGAGCRGQSKGSLDDWVDGIANVVTTPGLLMALGVSFAGALMAPLGRSGWVMHMAGASTLGKTKAAKLAASVWYDPSRYLCTWNGTANGIESNLEGFSGAVVCLDEIKEAAPKAVANIIHRISDNSGRVRSNRLGTTNLRQRTWSLTGLSTGEVTVADYLGPHAQGGHLVRCVDLYVRRGEMCQSAEHADQIDELCRLTWGTAGNAWAQYLVQHPERVKHCGVMAERITLMLEDIAPDAEAQRVLRQLALVAAALIEAECAGLWTCPMAEDVALDALSWAVSRVVEERGTVTSPETRALRVLLDLMESRPALFPHESEYQRTHQVVGMRADGAVYTTEGMLKGCPEFRATGVSARRFIGWMVEQGKAGVTTEQWVGGHRGSWRRLNISTSTLGSAQEDAF